jgi:hypothetical protein
VSPCRREHLNGDRVGEHVRKITDDAPGPFSESLLDRPVQLHDDVTELAGNFKDGYLSNGACSDPDLWRRTPRPDWPRWELGRDVGRVSRRDRDDPVVDVCAGTLRIARLLRHGGLDSVVLEREDAGHRDSGVARRQVDATKVWGGRNGRDATPRSLAHPSSADAPRMQTRTGSGDEPLPWESGPGSAQRDGCW